MDSTVIGLTLPSMDARDKDWMFGLTTFCNEEYFSLEDSFIDKLSLVAPFASDAQQIFHLYFDRSHWRLAATLGWNMETSWHSSQVKEVDKDV